MVLLFELSVSQLNHWLFSWDGAKPSLSNDSCQPPPAPNTEHLATFQVFSGLFGSFSILAQTCAVKGLFSRLTSESHLASAE